MKKNSWQQINLKPIKDGIDGYLCVAENAIDIPFSVQRVYYIYNLNNPEAVRGKHAHKELEQAIFCVNGSFELWLDDGLMQEQTTLDSPEKGVYMGAGVWHVMNNFSSDCVILVLASDFFDEQDYIRDYAEFKEFCHK
ncbi:MAG: FdtA/QdtA family cupin domain-containing protein [Candidatus Cloacimonetes bacterium]|nr:FdtA/QdtA family cupin domain-containing protein [Candidatus Cloacimonadota bacterium]